jgi:TP901 family phage tail tape measure protein
MATSQKFTIPTVFKAIDKFTAPVQRMEKAVSKMATNSSADIERMSRRMRKVGNQMNNVGNKMMIAGTAIVAPMALATREAVRFDDQLKDVQKTTGMSDDQLEKFGKSVLQMSKTTRSSIEDLLKIGVVGGQMAVTSDQMESFVRSADKFNVALGSDFGGGTEQAILSVAKISSLFKETNKLDIGEGISRAGSIINDLGAKTKATTENMTDFILRAGKIPEVLRPTIQETATLGAVLEQNGINSEVGSRGLSILLRRASTDISLFARQMGMTRKEASKLLANSPTEFLLKFSETFKELEASQVGSKLKQFGIGAEGAIGVISVLSQKQAEFNEVLQYSNRAFTQNTSLIDEANTKNSAMAGKLAMLKNQFRGLAIRLGQSLFPILNNILKTLAPIIERFANWIDRNQKLFATIVKVVAISGALSFAFGGLFKIIGGGLKLLSGMKFALMALSNPITAVVVGAGLLALSLYKIFGAKEKQVKIDKLQSEIDRTAISNIAEKRIHVMRLFNQLRRLNPQTNEYKDILKQLNQIQPEIVDKYDLTTKSLKRLNEAEKEVMKTMLDRARATAEIEIFQSKYTEALQNMIDRNVDVGLVMDVARVNDMIMARNNIPANEMSFLRSRLVNELTGNEQLNDNLVMRTPEQFDADINQSLVSPQSTITRDQVDINLNITVPEGFNMEQMEMPSSSNGFKINVTTTN